VEPGDQIAIGCTGSFPALNITVLTAAEAMNLKPSLVSSAASSQFGANHPQLMWSDMETILVEEGIIQTRSLAMSRGGFRDMGIGMTEDSRILLDQAIARSGVQMLESEMGEDFVGNRLKIYTGSAGQLGTYAAYVNVGGGMASIGGTKGNDQLGHGIIRPSTYRRLHEPVDSVAARFLAHDVPVINLTNVVAMAREHGLPVAPTVRPTIGEGELYHQRPLRKPFALLGIAFILALTTLFVRPPVWISTRPTWLSRTKSFESEARWMV
jgi:poly-gamma-glutamate system protein